MRGTINMRGVVESGSFKLLPEGIYNVIIIEVSERVTKNGDPMANVTFEVTSGDYSSSLVWDNIIFPIEGSLASKIKGRTMHFLHAIDEPYKNEELSYDTLHWMRKPAKIEVIHELYKGNNQAKVGNYIIDEVEDVPF
jgi:hypothetical protein